MEDLKIVWLCDGCVQPLPEDYLTDGQVGVVVGKTAEGKVLITLRSGKWCSSECQIRAIEYKLKHDRDMLDRIREHEEMQAFKVDSAHRLRRPILEHLVAILRQKERLLK